MIDKPQANGATDWSRRSPAALRLKLESPAAVPQQIEREGIASALSLAGKARVVIVRAPAGFGKTTVMGQYRQRLLAGGWATAWLTLDRSDNDVSRLLMGLEAAVGRLANRSDVEINVTTAASNVADTAVNVFERLAACEEPFALFLDDLEVVHDQAALGLLRELLAHLPADGRVVLGSRTLPNLPFGRLRARGDLLEIGASHLRFSLDEAEEFLLRRRSIPLSADDVQRLHAKTEGWVAALWLASVALDGSDAKSSFVSHFAGTDKSVADYLAEDVLERQSGEVRDFLLRTSILRQFDASLCRRLLPELDVDRILGDIANTELLLVPIGDSLGSYRYHSLFAEFLEAQLKVSHTTEVTQLHQRASRAYEALDRPVPAIDHAIAAGDIQAAVRLLEQHSFALLAEGRMRLLTRWFMALPEEALAGRDQLKVSQLWALCFARGPWEAMNALENSSLVDGEDPQVAPHLRALRPTALAMMDRYEEAYEVGRTAMVSVPSGVPFADHLLANTMATIATVVSEEAEARQLIETARQGQGSLSSAFNRMYSEADDGILDLRAGRLRQAIARFRIALSATHESEAQTRGNAFAGVPYAAAVYESGDVKRAAHLMQIYLPLVRDIALPDHVIMGYVTMSRITFAQGEVDQALELLSACEYVGHQRKLSRVVASAKLERARLLLMQGHERAAREELDRADLPEVWAKVQRLNYLGNELDSMDLARLRWDIHAGNTRSALGRIQPALAQALEKSRQLRALKLGLFEALALRKLGQSEAAQSALAELLRKTCAEGFVRMLLDEGAAFAGLLAEYHTGRMDGDQYHVEPLLGEYVARLIDSAGLAAVQQSPSLQQGDPGLTRKEIRVLQLLADGYSNQAMAEKLFVSESTVRTHLRNINSKLDSRSRTQAVAIARKMGLLR